jgi:hypothetical protein
LCLCARKRKCCLFLLCCSMHARLSEDFG